MKSADDVELRDRFGITGGRCLPRLFESHGVAVGVAFLAAKGTQLACRNADVGGVDVAIDIEIRHIAMHAFAHVVGQPADSQYVRGSVKHEAVFKVEALARKHFGRDGLQARVVRAKRMASIGGRLAGFRKLSLHIKMIQISEIQVSGIWN